MVRDRISAVLRELPEGVQLVAVSKYHPAELIREAYEGGQRVFGESHVQELMKKHEELPEDIEWHFIGHLQTNKVKYIAPFVSLIHSVDSDRLLREIDRQAERQGRIIPVLLQVHVAQEETKFGFAPGELLQYMQSGAWREYRNVRIDGLMCMATNTDDEERIARDFDTAHRLCQQIASDFDAFPADRPAICSWGMSHDYPIAVRHGSTMVRVGSLIFGDRVY